MSGYRYLIVCFILGLLLFLLYDVHIPRIRGFWQSDKVKECISRIAKKYPPIRYIHVHVAPGHGSYTRNKKHVYIATHDMKTGLPLTIREMTQVLLHEVTHVLCKEDIGHTNRFYKVYNHLLKKVQASGSPYTAEGLGMAKRRLK